VEWALALLAFVAMLALLIVMERFGGPKVPWRPSEGLAQMRDQIQSPWPWVGMAVIVVGFFTVNLVEDPSRWPAALFAFVVIVLLGAGFVALVVWLTRGSDR
jgi:hypothetical protein